MEITKRQCWSALVLVVLAGSLGVAGCSQQEPQAAPSSPSTSSPAARPQESGLIPATTPPPASIPSGNTSGPAVDPSAGRTTTVLPSLSKAPAAGLPALADPHQGGTYWATVVAYSPDGVDLTIAQSQEAVRALGYPVSNAINFSCLVGAEKLVPAYDRINNIDARTIALLFTSEADAQRFGKLIGDYIGVAKVQAYCMD